MHPRLQSFLIFLLLLAGSFVTYYYGLADTPRRDHGSYLIERALMETDWDWFWHSVSYSRARFLHPGDYYLFRPLNMTVLALKDIFFRNNLFALGAINITMMSVASFSVYFFSSRLLKPAVAFIVALLFMVQYAGLEMVAWGHISSYLLALAFFGFAMSALLEAGPDNKAALKKAGIFLLLGALVHEMVVVALVLAIPLLLFIRWRAGKGAEIGGIPLRSYILWVVAVPVLVYLGLDLFDYLYHGAPPLFSTADNSVYGGTYGPLGAIFTVAGTSAIAFLAPFKVELMEGELGTLAWNFEGMRPVIVAAGAVLSLAIMPAIYRCIRAIRAGTGSRPALPYLLVLVLFAGVVLGVGLGRVYSRGESYFYEATYYYSITAYIFCLLLAIGIYHLNKVNIKKVPLFLSRAILVAMVVLVAVNFAKTREALGRDWPERKKFAHMHLALDEALEEHSERYCIAGSAAFADVLPQMLRKWVCRKDDARIPGYLATDYDGSLWLAEIEVKPIRAFGEPKEVALMSITPDLVLSRDLYDRPDIAVTVHNKARILLLFGYRSLEDFYYVELYGPLLYGEHKTGGDEIPMMGYVGLPYVNSPQRLELRRGGSVIYIFVDGRLVAAMPEHDRGPGKTGIVIKDANVDIREAFSDFVVVDSVPRGTNSVEFRSIAKLLEMSEVAFPPQSY